MQSQRNKKVKNVTEQTLHAWPGIMKVFSARESLVSDIPAGDGKIVNLFLHCRILFQHFEETLEIVHSGLVSACRRFQRIKQRSLKLTDITHKLDKESPNHF